MKRTTVFCYVLIIATLFTLAFPITSYASTITEEQAAIHEYASTSVQSPDNQLGASPELLFSNLAKLTANDDALVGLETIVPAEYLESVQTNTIVWYSTDEYAIYLVKEGEFFDLLLIDHIYYKLTNYEYAHMIKVLLQMSFRRASDGNGEYTYIKINNDNRRKYFIANPSFLTVILNENELNYERHLAAKQAEMRAPARKEAAPATPTERSAV